MTKLASLLLLLLSLLVGHSATLSSTNFAWPTNLFADSDLLLGENTNRPTPFKTISTQVSNLFTSRTLRGQNLLSTGKGTNSPLVLVSNDAAGLQMWQILTNGDIVPVPQTSGSTSYRPALGRASGRAWGSVAAYSLEVDTSGTSVPGALIFNSQTYLRMGGAYQTNRGSSAVMIFQSPGASTFDLVLGPDFTPSSIAVEQTHTYLGLWDGGGSKQTNRTLAANGLFLTASNGIQFATSVQNSTGTKDAGLRRSSAARLAVTDGSTGAGSLQALNFHSTGTSNSIATNTAALFERTADFSTSVAGVDYTNTQQRAWVSQDFIIVCDSGEDARIDLLVDVAADGTYDKTVASMTFSGPPSGSQSMGGTLSAMIGPGWRFRFISTATGTPVILKQGVGQWALW